MLSSRPRQTVDHSALRCRLRDPETRGYLHFSGWPIKLVSGTAYAWTGTRLQADRLRERAEARGEPWPFEITEMEEA